MKVLALPCKQARFPAAVRKGVCAPVPSSKGETRPDPRERRKSSLPRKRLGPRVARMTPQNGNPVSRRRRKNGVFNKYLRAKYIDTQMKRFFKDNMAKSSFKKKKRKIKESSFLGLPSADTKEKKLRWSSFCGSYVFVLLLGGLRFRNNPLRTDEFPFFVCQNC